MVISSTPPTPDQDDDDYVLMPAPIITPQKRHRGSLESVHFSQPPSDRSSPPLSPHIHPPNAALSPHHRSPNTLSPRGDQATAISPSHHRRHRTQPSPALSDTAPELYVQSLAPVQGGSTALFDAWCVEDVQDDTRSAVSDSSADPEARGSSIWNQVEQYLQSDAIGAREVDDETHAKEAGEDNAFWLQHSPQGKTHKGPLQFGTMTEDKVIFGSSGRVQDEGQSLMISPNVAENIPPACRSHLLPPPFFRDLRSLALLSLDVPKGRLNFFTSHGPSRPPTRSFLRTGSQWLTQMTSTPPVIKVVNPDSIAAQTASHRSFFTQIDLHDDYQLIACSAQAGQVVRIADGATLRPIDFLDIPKMLRIAQPRYEAPSDDRINCLKWHGETLTLAVSYGHAVLILRGSQSASEDKNGSAKNSKLEEITKAWSCLEASDAPFQPNQFKRLSANCFRLSTMHCAASIILAREVDALGWVGDLLITNTSTSSPLREGYTFQLFFWRCHFDDKSSEWSREISTTPRVFTNALEIVDRSIHEIRTFRSMDPTPSLELDIHDIIPLLWHSANDQLTTRGPSILLKDETIDLPSLLAKTDMIPLHGDLQVSPGSRFMAVWYALVHVENESGSKAQVDTDALDAVTALANHLDRTVFLLFMQPRLRAKTLPQAGDTAADLNKKPVHTTEREITRRNSLSVREAAKAAMQRDQGRQHRTCGTSTRHCFRSGVHALLHKSKNTQAQDYSDGTSSDSAISSEEEVRRASSSWRTRTPYAKVKAGVPKTDYAGDFWELEGVLYDIDSQKKRKPVHDFCATELCHSSPLLQYTWSQRGSAYDDVFIPLTLVVLEASGRVLIWTESIQERPLYFEAVSSFHLDGLGCQITSHLGRSDATRTTYISVPTCLQKAGGLTKANLRSTREGDGDGDTSANKDADEMTNATEFSAFWRNIAAATKKDRKWLTSGMPSFTACSVVVLSSHRGQLGHLNSLILRKYLTRQQNIQGLINLPRVDDKAPLRSGGHWTPQNTEGAALTAWGQPLEAIEGIEFVFVLLPAPRQVDGGSPRLENRGVASLSVLAMRNISSQPRGRTAIRPLLNSAQISLPSQVPVSALLQVDLMAGSEMGDLSTYLVPTYYMPAIELSAWGEPLRIQEGLVLPPSRLLCLSDNNSLVAMTIRPQIFSTHKSQGVDPTPRSAAHTIAGGAHLMVRYLTELVSHQHYVSTCVGMAGEGTDVNVHASQVGLVATANSNSMHSTNPLHLAGYRDETSRKQRRPSQSKSSNKKPPLPPETLMDESQQSTDLSQAFWLTDSLMPTLGLPSIIKQNRSVGPLGGGLMKRWNFYRRIIPLTFPAKWSSPIRTSMPSLKSCSGSTIWQPLRCHVEALLVDSLGNLLAAERPEVSHRADSVLPGPAKRLQSINGIQAVDLSRMSATSPDALNLTNSTALIPDFPNVALSSVLQIPLPAADSPFELFFGVLSGSRKLIAFALAADVTGRLIASPVSLLGREVVNSLLAAVDPDFHPSSETASSLPRVDSRVISLQLVNLGPSEASLANPAEFARVRLVLHLAVEVSGVEEEQALITTLAVVRHEGDKQTPVALSFVSHAVDVYLDFSKGNPLGLGDAPYCIPDLPPVEDLETTQLPDSFIAESLSCHVINSCVRYCTQPGWLNFDLLASFPPLENPSLNQERVELTIENSFMSFVVPKSNAKHLLVPVYAVVNLSREMDHIGKPHVVPFFIARINLESSAKETETGKAEERETEMREVSEIYIMAIEISIRTLVVLTSDASLYIFEYRSSWATRMQTFLLESVESNNAEATLQFAQRIAAFSSAKDPKDAIIPHMAVQRISLKTYLSRTWRSSVDNIQNLQSKYVAATVNHFNQDLARRSTQTFGEETKPAVSGKPRPDHSNTTWRKMADTFSRLGSRRSDRSGSQDNFGIRHLSTESNSRGSQILLKLSSHHFSQWATLNRVMISGSLLTFFEPASKIMSKMPEVLLLNWPDIVNLAAPGILYEYDLLIRNQIASKPVTLRWIPTAVARPFVLYQIPIPDGTRPEVLMDEGFMDVGENSYRQGAEISGCVWRSVAWPDTDEADIPSDAIVHTMTWNSKRSTIPLTQAGKVEALPAIVAYSRPDNLSRVSLAVVNVPLPAACGKAMILERRSAPKSVYHPDTLWNWLKCGSVRTVLIILSRLYRSFCKACSETASDMMVDDSTIGHSSLAALFQFRPLLCQTGDSPIQPTRPAVAVGGRAADLFADDAESSDLENLLMSDDDDDEGSQDDVKSVKHKQRTSAEQDKKNGDGSVSNKSSSNQGSSVKSGGVNDQNSKRLSLVTTSELSLLVDRMKGLLEVSQGQKTREYLYGWPIALTLTGNEAVRLLGFLQFVQAVKLAEVASRVDFEASTDAGWSILYEALTQRVGSSSAIEVVPVVQLLLSVARGAYSIPEGPTLGLPEQTGLSTDDFVNGLLIENQLPFIDCALSLRAKYKDANNTPKWTWNALANIGAGYWLYEQPALEKLCERMPADCYAAESQALKLRAQAGELDTLDSSKLESRILENVAIWYCVINKQRTLASLFTNARNDTVSQFLLSDFEQERWRTAAVKNAWELVSQKRYLFSLAFFVLGKAGKEAVDITVRYLADAQLATLLARLYDMFVEPEGSILSYVLKEKLSSLALETQDVSLLLYTNTLLTTRLHPRTVLLTQTASGNNTLDFGQLEQGHMPESQVATLSEIEPSKQAPQRQGSILGEGVCLRRFSAFSSCPNILAFVLSTYSTRLQRDDLDLWISSMRALAEALSRRQLNFALGLLGFIASQLPQFNHLIPLKTYRLILGQWTMSFRARLSNPIDRDVRASATEWLDCSFQENAHKEALADLAIQFDKNPGLKPLFGEFQKVIKSCPVLSCIPSMGHTWVGLFKSKQDFECLQFLTDSLPIHYIASVLNTSLKNDGEYLSFNVLPAPLLSHLFEDGKIPWSGLRLVCHSLTLSSIQEKHQLTTASLDAECASLVISLIKEVGTMLVEPYYLIGGAWAPPLFGLLHELTNLYIFHPAFMASSIFEQQGDRLWRLLVSLFTLSLGAGLMVFDSLCGCLRGRVTRLSATFNGECDSSVDRIWTGMTRLHAIWANLIPRIPGGKISSSMGQSSASAILLTLLQDVLYSLETTSSKSEGFATPPLPRRNSPPPSATVLSGSGGVSAQTALHSEPPPKASVLSVPLFSQKTKARLIALSADLLCLAYTEAFLRWLRALHFLKVENKQVSLLAHFKWLERQLSSFTIHLFADRVEAQLVAAFSSLTPIEMTYVFTHSDDWEVVLSSTLSVPHLSKAWTVYDPTAKMRHLLLRGLTGHCQPCGWGIASLPPYKLSEASALVISTFQSVEGAAKFHLVRGAGSETGGVKSQSLGTFQQQQESVSSPSIYCPVAMVSLNMQVPLLHGRPAQLLMPYLGNPGVPMAPWTQRCLATLLTVATTKGVKELPFHTHSTSLADPWELMALRSREDCFATFAHVIISGVSASWQRSLESCRIHDGFDPKKSLKAHTTADVILKWWRLYVQIATQQAITKALHDMQTLTLADIDAMKPLNETQYSALADHPFLPVIAGILEQSTHHNVTSSSSQQHHTPVMTLFAYNYLPASPEHPSPGHFKSIGALSLPAPHVDKSRFVLGTKNKNTVDDDPSLPTAPASQRTSVSDEKKMTVVSSMPFHLTAHEAGELISAVWSPTGDAVYAATDNGWVLGWTVMRHTTSAITISKPPLLNQAGVITQPESEQEITLGHGLPFVVFRPHESSRTLITIPTDQSIPIIVTAGKGVGPSFALIRGSKVSSSLSASPTSMVNVSSPLSSRLATGEIQSCVSEGDGSFSETLSKLESNSGFLAVWDLNASVPHSQQPMMRATLLHGDFGFVKGDHPTDIVFWPPERLVIYGTLDGTIKCLSMVYGRCLCLHQPPRTRDVISDAAKKKSPSFWIRKLYICQLTNRLIALLNDCTIQLFDLTPLHGVFDTELTLNEPVLHLLREIKPQSQSPDEVLTRAGSAHAALDSLGLNFLTGVINPKGAANENWTYLGSTLIRPSHIALLALNGKMIKVRI